MYHDPCQIPQSSSHQVFKGPLFTDLPLATFQCSLAGWLINILV